MKFYKSPAEVRNLELDFAAKTGSGIGITLVSVTATDLISGEDATSAIIQGASASDQKVLIKIQGGEPGDCYQIEVEVTTDADETLHGDAILTIYRPQFAEFQQAVAERIQDSAGKLDQTVSAGCIREAIAGRYSRALPLRAVADFVGDGVTYQWALDTANFPGWVKNFSWIEDLEYPAGDQVPNLLDKDEWQIYYPESNAPELRLLAFSPGTGKTLRVTFTIPHSEDGSDVSTTDFYGVVNLAASLAAGRLQAIYTQLGDAAFGGDAVDYKSKAAQYAALSSKLNKEFEGAFALDKDEPQPASSASTEWREDLEAGGRRLIH